MIKRLYLSIAAVLLFAGLAFAQNRTVTGTVVDPEGLPVVGAAVVVEGTTQGTSTGLDGTYSVSAPSDGVLNISFLGYKTMLVPVAGKSVVDVVLEEDHEVIEDVVVVGYGSGRKVGTVIGSVDQVKADKIENRPSTNIMDAMQGQVAGLQISTTNGELDTPSMIRLHGMGSLATDNTPLILLDGAPITTTTLLAMNQNDIASITVLKDASATSIYGARAAGGVIYVTTKKGSRGSEDVDVTLRASYSMSNMPKLRMKPMTTKQYVDYATEVCKYVYPSIYEDKRGEYASDFEWYNKEIFNGNIDPTVETNWFDLLTNSNAPLYQVDLSVSGGSKKTAYYFSGNYSDQTGVVLGSSRTRYTFRADVDTRATKWLKLGMNIGIGYAKASAASTNDTAGSLYGYNPIISSYIIPHYQRAYNDDGSVMEYLDIFNLQNPMITPKYTPNTSNRIQMNGAAFVEINPVEGLTLRSNLSANAFDYRSHSHMSPLFPTASGEPTGSGSASEMFQRTYEWTWTNTAEYLFSVAEKHNFGIILGHESIYGNIELYSVATRGQIYDGFMTINQGTENSGLPSYNLNEYAFNSVFGRFEYNYDNRYFVDASLRNDASSRFGSNRRNGIFWAAGVMWNLKNEAFLKDNPIVTAASLKVSYGTQGNANIGYYDQYSYLTSGLPYNGVRSWILTNVGDSNLAWEQQSTLSVGGNVSILGRLSLELEWYRRQTDNMLMPIPKALSSGVSYVVGNVGAMRNTGVDLTLGYDIFKNRDWFVHFYTTFNYNCNRLLKLWDPELTEATYASQMQYKVGAAFPNWYTYEWRGVNSDTGEGQWTAADGGVTSNFNEAVLVDTHKTLFAPYTGGFGLNVSWKGLALAVDFSWAAGNWLYNNTKYFNANAHHWSYNQIEEVLDYWKEPGDKAKYPSLEYSLKTDGRKFDTSMLEDGSYLRLKNIQLSYSFPASLLRKSGFIKGVKVYAGARNILTATKYTGLDPEVVDKAFDVDNYPNTRQWTFGAELKF